LTGYLLAVFPLGLVALGGCSPTGNRLNLVTYDEAGKAKTHYTDFRRASFRQTSDGKIELVLHSQQASKVDPTQTIEQVVYLQTFWTPRPGTTYVDSTQVDTRIEYAIMTPPTGMRYDGGGFITYKIDKITKEAVGYLESGNLSPAYKMGDAVEPFGPARIYGRFRAKENGADVVNSLQMLGNQFVTPAK
jgi:hypothetical protein